MKEDQPLSNPAVKELQDSPLLPGRLLKKRPTPTIVSIAILGLILIISLGITGYLVVQRNSSKGQVSPELLSIPTPTINQKTTLSPIREKESTENPSSHSLTEQVLREWKTYEDPKYGFKFDNPGQYILEIGAGHDGVRLYDPLTYQDVQEPYLHSALFINIAAYENPEHLSSVDWFEKYVVRDSVNPIEHYEILQVGSINAVKYYWSEAGGGYTTILADGNYVVLLIDTGISQQDFKRLISTLSVP